VLSLIRGCFLLTTLFISTIVVLLPLILYSSKTGKIMTKAGNWVLAGGAFTAGEHIVDGF